MGGVGAAALFAFSLAGLAACGGNPAAIAARDHEAAADDGYRTERAANEATTSSPVRAVRAAREDRDTTAEAVTLVAGKPMWAENRTHTARENAQYQFEQHGDELKAASLDDFLAKAHRFVGRPPEGTLTLTRENGDTVMFDPKSGLFGVARSDGAPRTVFKPSDGMAYWRAQQASGGDTRSSRTSTSSRRDDARG